MKKAPSGAFLMFRRHLGIIYMECLDRSESAPRQIDPIPQFSTLLKLLFQLALDNCRQHLSNQLINELNTMLDKPNRLFL